MKLKAFLLLTLFLVFMSQSKAEQHQHQWVESCPNSQLCFEHPNNLQPANVQIIDSSAGQFLSDCLTLTYDLGWYASQFNEMTNATVEPITIDGHAGNILIDGNLMALRIPELSGKIRFSMLLKFKQSPQPEHGRKIFNSIRFSLN